MNNITLFSFFVFITISNYTLTCLKREEIVKDNLKILIGNLNESIKLNCELSKTIHILDASYGNPSVDNFLIKKSSLDAPHTLPVVQMMCEGKENCDINVNNETFKILSLIKDFHKLVIKYSCVSFKRKSFPSYKIKAKRGNDNTWNIEFQGEASNKELYLHVHDINAICEKPLLKKKYIDVNEAEQECNTIKKCVYIIFNIDGYTLCESPFYKDATIQKNAKIYIKMSYISGNIPENYDVFPNFQGVCEKNEVMYEMDAALSLEDVYKKCKEINCDYFTMSTANGVKGASKNFRNYAWFCKGFPKYVSHEGFIFGKNNKNSKNPKQRLTIFHFVYITLSFIQIGKKK
ncbi:conserved Plasmodium protein, unknown function [Plasmodium malariae]|uniref:SUEL-type lectin domain-containing protein n=1 Tax=Plasmodium malariae TaxID=5858 RepID=A0A1D3SPD5_PLAMA|nr:conserved Plasmodium protein, unknown function [Plasmodium malariae]SCO93777.1 conserved Plasmodium protein, unknown function [Plasmodium malariae]